MRLNRFILPLVIFLSACNSEPIFYQQDKYSLTVIEGDDFKKILDYFKRDDINITEFKFMKPVESVDTEINYLEFDKGLLDDENLKLVSYYSDNNSKSLAINYKNLPKKYSDILSETGNHKFVLSYRNVDKEITFKVNYNPDVKKTVRYYNYTEDVIKTIQVTVGETINDQIPEVPDREEDYRFIYDQKRWSEDLTDEPINYDRDIYSEYTPKLKRYHGYLAAPLHYEGKGDGWQNRLLYSRPVEDKEDELISIFHVARLYRSPIFGYKGTDAVHHNEGQETTLTKDFSQGVSSATNLMNAVMSTGLGYDSSKDSSFINGNEKAYPSNFTYIAKDTTYATVSDLLGGNTETKFDNDGIIYEIYPTYFEDIYDQVLADWPHTITRIVPASSPSGNYRLSIEADIDVLFAIHSKKNHYPTQYDNDADLIDVTVYVTVDPESIEALVDFSRDDQGGQFGSTLYKKYSSYDIYWDSLIALYGEDY